MTTFLHIGLGSAILLLAAGTALSLWQHPHWLVRTWDFPRLQIATLLLALDLLYLAMFWQAGLIDWLLLAVGGTALVWQAYRIYPYTRAAPARIQRARGSADARICLISSNVKMENRDFPRWHGVIRQADPDIVLVLEADDWWATKLAALETDYPFKAGQPQNNFYGMLLLSRYPLEQVELRYLVEADVPSIRCRVCLPGARDIVFYGVHPRPPEPVRNNSAAARDAEAIVVAREIAENKRDGDPPTIVAGDFNDVAWSYSTGLFMRISGLLDPRIGRGPFNTFHADLPFLRVPLDHCFHSDHFTLVDIRRLAKVGSDHLPLAITLALEPDASCRQDELEVNDDHREDAQDRLGMRG